jgi:hypothetical protein
MTRFRGAVALVAVAVGAFLVTSWALGVAA